MLALAVNDSGRAKVVVEVGIDRPELSLVLFWPINLLICCHIYCIFCALSHIVYF